MATASLSAIGTSSLSPLPPVEKRRAGGSQVGVLRQMVAESRELAREFFRVAVQLAVGGGDGWVLGQIAHAQEARGHGPGLRVVIGRTRHHPREHIGRRCRCPGKRS